MLLYPMKKSNQWNPFQLLQLIQRLANYFFLSTLVKLNTKIQIPSKLCQKIGYGKTFLHINQFLYCCPLISLWKYFGYKANILYYLWTAPTLIQFMHLYYVSWSLDNKELRYHPNEQILNRQKSSGFLNIIYRIWSKALKS